MKLCVWFMVIWVTMFSPTRASAQSEEIQQLLLNIEKLNQLREILNSMYKGYQVVSQGYNKIKDIASGNYKLHEVFLDGLYQVNPSIKKYQHVADIIAGQAAIVKEYKAAFSRFKAAGVFTPSEILYLSDVYKALFDDSLENLEELIMVITARQLRMSDAERLAAIDRIHADVDKKLIFLRAFNQQQAAVAFAKTREAAEISTLRTFNGLK